MARLRIVWFGKRRREPLMEVVDDYAKRLGHYTSVEISRLDESNKADESQRLLQLLEGNKPDALIALDERGVSLTTTALAARIQAWHNTSVRQVTLVIGGADGLSEVIRQRSTESWALSALTLPHRLALAVLVEQLYRAHTILRGEPYHRR